MARATKLEAEYYIGCLFMGTQPKAGWSSGYRVLDAVAQDDEDVVTDAVDRYVFRMLHRVHDGVSFDKWPNDDGNFITIQTGAEYEEPNTGPVIDCLNAIPPEGFRGNDAQGCPEMILVLSYIGNGNVRFRVYGKEGPEDTFGAGVVVMRIDEIDENLLTTLASRF